MNKLCFLWFCIMICGNLLWGQQQREITFQVSLQDTPFYSKDSILSIGLRGSQPPLSWVKGVQMTDMNSDGNYEATVIFDSVTNEEVYFKYVLNNLEWEGGDARKITINGPHQDKIKAVFRYVKPAPNPFQKFMGEWTLKNDEWEQSEDGTPTEILKIPGHHTLCKTLNTNSSLLWSVKATSATGHALWSYDETNGTLHHLSSFYPNRIGIGEGTVDAEGNVFLKTRFSGEPEGTYRQYSYTWVHKDEYILKSIQYDDKGKPTGHYYGGTFIRIHRP